jgi:hypothetical protein
MYNGYHCDVIANYIIVSGASFVEIFSQEVGMTLQSAPTSYQSFMRDSVCSKFVLTKVSLEMVMILMY